MSLNFTGQRLLGLNLIPCFPASKKPKVSWLEYQEKRCELPLNDNENAAVICGKSSGDLVVIDIDKPEKLDKFFSDFEVIKKNTLVVKTGSGGYHVYMRAIGELPKIMFMEDVEGNPMGEIRGKGAYVIAVGSVHPDTKLKYEVISETTNINTFTLDGLIKSLATRGVIVKKSLPPVLEIVKGVPLGQRDNATYKYTAHLKSIAGLDVETAWIEIQRWAKQIGHNCTEDKLRSTFESAWKRVPNPTIPEVVPTISIADAIKKVEYVNFKKLKEVSSNDEGEDVSFDCFIAAMGAYRTVTTIMLVHCPKSGIEQEVESDGYINPKMPNCPQHKTKMEQKKIIKTNDMVQILLQELPENLGESEEAVRTARVIGPSVFNIGLGDRVRVTGTFKSFTEPGKRDNQVAILVKCIECTDTPQEEPISELDLAKIKGMINDDFIHDVLVPSCASELNGMEVLKEVGLLWIVGAYKMDDIRGDINVAFVGNPSGGKSTLVKKLIRLCKKGAYVNANTSSAAGLVYGMVKLSDGTSVPQAGPVVLMDGGHCGIDEMDKTTDQVHSALLEVMEQQSVSFDKAGGHRRQNARTTILMACNPKGGKWDLDPSVKPMDNINLPEPLMSRCDWIVGAIIKTQMQRSKNADKILSKTDEVKAKPILSESLLKQYLSHVKDLKPEVSEEARKKLKEFYMSMVTKMEGEGLPYEERQLEGLLRSSIARAKLLMKEKVEAKDVDSITELYKKSLESLNLKVEGNYIQSMFESDETGRVSKESAFMKIWSMCQDEHGLVEETQLFMKLIEHHPKHFPDALVCKKFFKQYEGTKILIDSRTGLYRMRM